MKADIVKTLRNAIRDLAARDKRLSLNEIRVVIALERAVARLQCDPMLAQHLVFKGGLVLLKHFESERFTRDADALAVDISKDTLQEVVCKAIADDLEDGLWYGDIQIEDLADQGQYGAYRFDFAFQIGAPDLRKLHKLSRIHIDIGFSDHLLTTATSEKMPSVLPHSQAIAWRIYPIEHIVAEKLETLCQRGSASSRAKDIYDLVFLLPRCTNSTALWDAIKQTFANRRTALPEKFLQHAQTFELGLLTSAWPGVRLLEEPRTFDEVWEALLKQLRILDSSAPGRNG